MHPSAVSISARTTAEIAFDHSRIALQTGGIVRQDDPAGFDDITAFRQGKGDARVLLDEQDRHSRTPKGKDCFRHLLDNAWRESQGRFVQQHEPRARHDRAAEGKHLLDRKSTRLNSSHLGISYAVFCLKKKKQSINKKQNLRGSTRTTITEATLSGAAGAWGAQTVFETPLARYASKGMRLIPL